MRSDLPQFRTLQGLLSGEAVRARAHDMLALADAGQALHFHLNRDQLRGCAEAVVKTILTRYPTLDIPRHSRWRHFFAGGLDRWAGLDQAAQWPDPSMRAHAAFDLATIAVLLDGGAGPDWRYHERETGKVFTRSEGLAVATFRLFASGAWSLSPSDPWRVDAERLAFLPLEAIKTGFQISAENLLIGFEARVDLVRRLGQAVLDNQKEFAVQASSRPGNLFDVLKQQSEKGQLSEGDVLAGVLHLLQPVWPTHVESGNANRLQGDIWYHPRVAPDAGTTAGLVPFHKLSQWLAYSLIEPLEEAGIHVAQDNALTGLAEYRNGGLFLDTGVLQLKNPEDAHRLQEVGSTLVVEWRALTVALLDEITPLVRARLALSPEKLPLAALLEGGTWAAGRQLAQDRRADGAPPLRINSDGTVF